MKRRSDSEYLSSMRIDRSFLLSIIFFFTPFQLTYAEIRVTNPVFTDGMMRPVSSSSRYSTGSLADEYSKTSGFLYLLVITSFTQEPTEMASDDSSNTKMLLPCLVYEN